jgi:hypothetical protein
MKSQLIYKKFFVYSKQNKTGFSTDFSDGINIIHGKNTSGKSTIIQAIHYTFGINDEKHKLTEIISEKVIFRLDFVLKKETEEHITIIRDEDFIYIKRENNHLQEFNGISANNSKEHIKLKEYFAELFGCNLHLESSGDYKPASLEAIFLPYYVAQDWGWVLPLQSFRGFNYFKNFKNDYYDYYLGITNEFDRKEKQELENKKKDLGNFIKFLEDIEKNREELKLSKLQDEPFILKSKEYLDSYINNKNSLINSEREYVNSCNKLRFSEQRLKVLKAVLKLQNKERPSEDNCPTCHQRLPNSVAHYYKYYQDFNNTNKEIVKIKEDIKYFQRKINSTNETITVSKETIEKQYSILIKYKIDDLTFDKWLDNKTNVKLLENILNKKEEAKSNRDEINKELEKFKTDKDVQNSRDQKDNQFKRYFESNLEALTVQRFDNNDDFLPYKMHLFPKQGVELLKTMLAYYFAFNKIIKETEYVHRLPFMLDAIFKEDIDRDNKENILKFIYNNKPINEQIIFSIAESEKDEITVAGYNENLMNNEATLIETNLQAERSILKKLNKDQEKYLEETLELID